MKSKFRIERKCVWVSIISNALRVKRDIKKTFELKFGESKNQDGMKLNNVDPHNATTIKLLTNLLINRKTKMLQ